MSTTKNNILIIMADQLTAKALGCYGNTDVVSPHIDELAATGIRFEQAYTSSPLCTPGRYAFMTGQHISVCGGYDNAAYMPGTMPTLAHYLRLMGYKTTLAGKMHFVGADQLHGFEDRLTTDIYPADFGWVPDWEKADERIDLWYHNMSSVKQAGVAAITNQLSYDDEVGAASVRAIYDHSRSEDERPFCLVSSFIHPHDPYATRQKYWDLYHDKEISLPTVARRSADETDAHNKRLEKVIALDAVEVTEEDIISARRAYYGNVSYVDEWVGRIRSTLDECGLAANTTIIFLSDHGDMLGEHGLWYKMSFREWSCRIPMIIHHPGQFAPCVVTRPVAQIDVLPTLLDLAHRGNQATIPDPIDPLHGLSMLPMCSGEALDSPPRVLSEYLAEGTGAPMLMVRNQRYKYIQCSSDPDQLYDLQIDPDELDNLAEDPSLVATLQELKSVADAHWDSDEIREKVIRDQKRRRAVSAALRVGRYQGWDYDPRRDPSEEYTRSHLDLTRFDISSRFPRPKPFEPDWR